ncbi:MAG: alpha-amylase family glycosyl hydrolase [Gemmatimonadota bacterium]
MQASARPRFRPPTIRPARLAAFFAACLVALCCAAGAAAQAPTVDRIEPANWWTGMHRDTVQLMVYGENLDGITARFADGGPEVVATHDAASASYAFVYVHVPADLAPGSYALELARDGGSRAVNYPILAREPREGRHRGFGPEDVVYLIMPDRFANAVPANDVVAGLPDEHDRSVPGARHGGDLQGIIEQLDYLDDLGVTALWLNPVLENAAVGTYHGYAATDLYRIDPRLGTNEDYRRLVREAHARGLKVIFDHIANHIGIEHPWMDDLPTGTWIHGTVEDHLSESHYMMSVSDPYAPPAVEEALKEFWFVDGMPDLNQEDPLLADYLIQNMIWWIEYTGLDGVREDTYPYAHQAFLADWAAAILREYPDFNIVGEIWKNEPAFTALFQRGTPLPRDFETNLPTVMDFALADAWREYMAGQGSLEGVYQVLAQDFLYASPDSVMTLIGNHDMPRSAFIAEDRAKVKQALAMLLTTRGIPQILYGTEIGMVGGESHVELRADMPGGWPDDERSVFTAEGRTPAEAEMFDYLRRLLHVRQRHPALTRGELIHFAPAWNNNVYRYLRRTEDETVLVVVNGYDDDRIVALDDVAPHLPGDARFTDLMTGEPASFDPADGVPVDGWGVRLLLVR